jgi:predicted HTH transcriptional regulator
MNSSNIFYEELISKNQNLTFNTLKLKFEEKNIEYNKFKMITSGFIKGNKFTNLAYIFSDQYDIETKIGVYFGLDRSTFKSKKEFSGSIISQIDKTLEYCDICNETRIIIDGSPMRKEYNSYIKLALREAILNCFCHRDYNKRSNIKIEYFNNRCEIISPGGFYGGLTIEEALSGVQSFRNKYLVQLLHKLGYIENYSSGLNRIISEYEKYNIIPVIESSLNMFKITFPNINYNLDNITINEPSYYIKDNVANNVVDVADKFENVADNVANESLEKILIAAIRKNNKISRKDLARLINKSSKTIERLLKNNKRIIRVGSTKSGHWEIIEDEKNE